MEFHKSNSHEAMKYEDEFNQHCRDAEIIRCHCSSMFAACIDGEQDKDWEKSKRTYLAAGCTVEKIPAKDVAFKMCNCDKRTPKTNQLNLFK